MAKFTWYGPREHWHPVCTTELLYDNQDGDTERIACLQNQCVDPQAVTPVTTPCRTALLPIGSTTSRYLWGVDGSPFTITPDLSSFPESPNEFGAPGYVLQPREAVAPGENLYQRIFQPNGTQTITKNLRAWSDGQWIPTERAIVGYRALEGAGIESLSINPSAAIGSRVWEPTNNAFLGGGCSVRAQAIDRPVIEYYDVGSTGQDRPPEHHVTFHNVEIPLYNAVVTRDIFGIGPPNPYDGSAPANYVQGGGVAWDSMVHVGPREDLLAEQWKLSEPRQLMPIGGQLESLRSAMVEIPSVQANLNTVPPQMIRRYESGPIFHTGFRMQKHLQANYYAQWVQSGTSYVTCGVRHLETRMYRAGYFATWQYVSCSPQDLVTTGGAWNGDGTWTLYCIARGSVTVRVTYHDMKDREPEIKKHEYGPDRDDGPGSEYPIIAPAFQKYNPPHKQWIWERTAVQNQYGQWQPIAPGDWAGEHAVGGFIFNNFILGTTSPFSPQAVSIASAGPMPFGILNPLSPRHPSASDYYRWPMTSTVHTNSTLGILPAYFVNAVPDYLRYTMLSGLGGSMPTDNWFTPDPARVPFSATIPNDYAFWRRRQ